MNEEQQRQAACKPVERKYIGSGEDAVLNPEELMEEEALCD